MFRSNIPTPELKENKALGNSLIHSFFCKMRDVLKYQISDELPNKDHFKVVKQLVASSPHRKRTDTLYHPMQTYCFDSANFIVKIFIGAEFKSANKVLAEDFVGEAKSAEAQKLFSTSPSSEHLIFHIIHGRAHAFVIEKKSDLATTWWRIYQSQMGEYSLAEWLAVDKWQLSSDKTSSKQFELYGKGRKITDAKELRDCILALAPPLMGGASYDSKEDFFSVASSPVDKEHCHQALRDVLNKLELVSIAPQKRTG